MTHWYPCALGSNPTGTLVRFVSLGFIHGAVCTRGHGAKLHQDPPLFASFPTNVTATALTRTSRATESALGAVVVPNVGFLQQFPGSWPSSGVS